LVLSVLKTMSGVRLARMSGSGATCFALFETMVLRDLACDKISDAYPSWWTLRAALR
jgi:4-diphosphocytidyl-2-C-methyl-D-erythritol kinase